MSKRRNSSGFTLVELIVAVVLGAIVLMGSFSILTNMVTAEVNGMRAGTVTAWTLAGINTMNTDIAGAGALSYPAPGAADDNMIVCTNWFSDHSGGASQEVVAGAPNTVSYYCWDTIDAAPSPFNHALLRRVEAHAGSTVNPLDPAACPTLPPVCRQSVYAGGAFGSDTIVATGVYQDPNNALARIFNADLNTLNAVRLRFVVGNPAPNQVSAGGNNGTVTAAPVSIPFNTEIILED